MPDDRSTNPPAPGEEAAAAGRGADFLQLRVGEAPAGGLAQWLAGRLREAVADGRLPLGSRLPPSRVLAGELRVSRGVVTEAYRRLAEDGHVEGRGRAGTVVVLAGPPAAARLPAPPRPPASPEGLFADTGPDVFDRVRAAPAAVDLSPGVPDLGAFPRAAWLRAEREAAAGLPDRRLGYGDPRGEPELRRAIAVWLARYRGIAADPADVLVVAGTSQALTMLARVLSARGIRQVAVEDPGSLGARQHVAHGLGGPAGGRPVTPPVPVDGDGLRVDALRACGAPAVLVAPAHQFPTGVVLSGARRRQLAAWARGGGLIVEDDYDAEHRYDRPPVAALRATLPDAVCYLGSVSKVLAPGVRIGWLLAPAPYRDALVAEKRFTDLGNPVLPQLALARLMASGVLERHVRMLRRRHRQRRDAMVAAVREHLPGAEVHGAAAGLHVTVTFGQAAGPGAATGAAALSDVRLAAASLDRGVRVHPLSWHRQLPGPPGLVLGYAAHPPGVIARGVAEVGAAMRGLLSGG